MRFRNSSVAPRSPLYQDRRGGIAILFAILCIPLVGLVGLAIDFAQLDQTRNALYLAANSAALNAVKVAATGSVNNDPNYVSEATSAGGAWLTAELGKLASTVNNVSRKVTITTGTTVTATVTLSGQASSVFGRIFGIPTYAVSVTAQSSMTTAPYLEVVLMLDNSSSMSMGATIADMTTLLDNSPCDLSNEYTSTNGSTYAQSSNSDYDTYQCSYHGPGPYDGTPSCPVTSGSTTYATVVRILPSPNPPTKGPACPSKVTGQTAYAGPPCAFACHWDSSKAAGLGNDLWAMARRKGVTLRSDVVKTATNQILATMQTDNQSINNLSVGVYTFGEVNPATPAVTRIYPNSGEAGSNFAAAETAVGLPPTAGSGTYTETGLQPVLAITTGNNDNTNFQADMTLLAQNYVTTAGTGASAASPRKVLILITDGIEDDYNTPANESQPRYAMPSTACQQFKNMGYQVYVAYTPYYPIMETYYLAYIMAFNETAGTDSVSYNLQNCSSSSSSADLATYYTEATDQASLSAALQGFLNAALLYSPARFTE